MTSSAHDAGSSDFETLARQYFGAWGDALRESEFTRWVYQGLCGLEKEQRDEI